MTNLLNTAVQIDDLQGQTETAFELPTLTPELLAMVSGGDGIVSIQ